VNEFVKKKHAKNGYGSKPALVKPKLAGKWNADDFIGIDPAR
jgi:hypothetical protein